MKHFLSLLFVLFFTQECMSVPKYFETDTIRNSGNIQPTSATRFYISSSLDGALFSSSTIKYAGSYTLSTIRFSCFFNYGITLNYDCNNNISVFTGIGIKNIGFILKRNDSTIKYRSYNLGIPLGIKVGNMSSKVFGFIGGGYDLIANFKEKEFSSKDALFGRHRKKTAEWFGNRTPLFMPYVFCGSGIGHDLTIKAQYYLTNYFNEGFVAKQNGIDYAPYKGYDIHLFYLSVGINIYYGKRGNNISSDDD